MTYSKLAKSAGLAGLALALSATSALAIDAVATSAVHVRSGPGTGYGIVDTLHAGELVDVNQCNAAGTWCHVFHTGPDGWVSRNYLGAPGNAGGSGSSIQFNVTIPLPGGGSITFGTGGVSGSGGGGSSGGGGGGGEAPRVCFYNHANYGGAESCVPAGTNDAEVTGFWNDKVSSLRVFGGARVRLFQDAQYCGGRNVFANDKAQLGTLLNNKASAYQTWTGSAPAVPPCGSSGGGSGSGSGGSGSGSGIWVVQSHGDVQLRVAFWADLDTGDDGASVPILPFGADLLYERTDPAHHYLKPIRGARMARVGNTPPNPATCTGAALSTTRIPIPAMPVGSYVCMRTSEGNISRFRVDGYTGGNLTLNYLTWAN